MKRQSATLGLTCRAAHGTLSVSFDTIEITVDSPVIHDRTPCPREDACRALVTRILASDTFQRTPRLRELLTFITQRALDGQSDSLNEREIGCSVFSRAADYNHNDDNIVRVQVRQLRLRLEEYFRTTGVEEPLILDIPKGSYVPVFRPREDPPAANSVSSSPEPASPPPSNPWKAVALLAAAVACVAAAAAIYLASQRGETPARTAAGKTSRLGWPLSQVFSSDRETLVVVPDVMYVLNKGVTGQSISLADYLSPDYPAKFLPGDLPPSVRNNLLQFSQRTFSSYSSIMGASWLSRLSEAEHLRMTIRHARQLGPSEFRDHHVILFGSASSNPWLSLFVPTLNFQAGIDKTTGVRYFLNREPAPGEPARYNVTWTGATSTDYGLIALLPNSSGQGKVLLLHGSMTEGTEACISFLSDPGKCARLRAALGNPGNATYFEALIRVSALVGATQEPEIITVRPWKPPVK